MLTETKKKDIIKFIISTMDFIKVLLGIFLSVIVFTMCINAFEVENAVPFYDTLNAYFVDLSTVFYTPRFSEEETLSSLIFLSLATISLMLLFELISSSIADLLKMFEKSTEEARAADNEQINQRIQRNYEEHLKNSMQFVLILKLAFEQSSSSQVFQDENLEKENEENKKQILAEIRTTIIKNINCKCTVSSEFLIIQIPSAEVLNRILFYIKNLCQVPKYTFQGLIYYMSVIAYPIENTIEKAISEAKKLVDLKIKNKIVCYQITGECLNFVPTNNFKAMSLGDYYEIKDSIYELVNKN